MRIFRSFILKPLLHLLDDLLVEIYASSKQFVRELLLQPAFQIRRLLLFIVNGMSFHLYLFQGTSADTRHPMKVAYFREGRGMEYLVNQLFEDGLYQQEYRRSVPFWKLNAAAKALSGEVDLMVVERNTILKWTPSYGAWVSTPTWVRMVTQVELGKDWNAVERSFKKQERNIRRLRRSEYTYRISKRVEDFEFFYTRMYVPLVRQRHADEAFIDTRKNLLKYFEHGFLLQILDRDGNPVAADLDYLNGDMLFGIACGVLDGDPVILEEGTLSAIYYYTLKWCHENRIPRCDICEVRPFTQDGVYLYKRRWGYQPMPELWNTREWLLWVPQPSSPAMHWIHEHPFLPEFAKSGSDILFQGTKNQFNLRGLFKQRVG